MDNIYPIRSLSFCWHCCHSFGMEPYLNNVSNKKYRHALSRLRTSSHALRIESARHETPVPSVENRVCHRCNVLEDEVHFLVVFPLYECERKKLFEGIGLSVDVIENYSHIELFICILNMTNQRHLEQIAKFVYLSLEKHKMLIS